MVLAAMPFVLHYRVWVCGQWHAYAYHKEVVWWLRVFGCCAIVMLLRVWNQGEHFSGWLMQLVSMSTTTGYVVNDLVSDDVFFDVIVVILSIIGGCSLSTSGGMKWYRLQALLHSGWRDVDVMQHRQSVVQSGDYAVYYSSVRLYIWGGLLAYFLGVTGCYVSGMDLPQALATCFSMLTNLGVAWYDLYDYVKPAVQVQCIWILLMWIGRLEVVAVLGVLGQLWRIYRF